jgi:hypothetical protein
MTLLAAFRREEWQMSNTQAKRQRERSSEMAEVSSTWGMLIDQGMHEAKTTLVKMDSGSNEDGNPTREAWMMVNRAFQSSAQALRALTS